jgi:electron transport complex protein RnfC
MRCLFLCLPQCHSSGAILSCHQNHNLAQRGGKTKIRSRPRKVRTEEEKEAKRLARKKAAEEAKARLDEQKSAGVPEHPVVQQYAPITPAPTPVTPEPIRPESTEIESPEVAERQGKKFARLLESAEGRVKQLQQQLQECGDAARADMLRAQLKQAELKLQEARKKHEDFERGISTPLDQRLQKVAAKIQASPLEAQRNAVSTLEKRLAVAVEKMREAEREQKPTLAAMTQGVRKLQVKLEEAKADLLQLEQEDPAAPATVHDAAAMVIARAQAKAAAAVNMSSEEKHAEQLQSQRARVEKARTKLAEAEASGSEHAPALRAGLEKLESKLRELEVQK